MFASLKHPLRVLALAGLMFLAPAVTPPTAYRLSSSGARGSTRNSTPSLTWTYPAPLRILENAEAWKHLPAAEKGHGHALPVWARILAKTLPRTTSAMLELDYLHRARSPIEAILRGQLRWVAAHTSGCRYSEAHAAADLRRAGMEEADIQTLAGDLATLPLKTWAALQFARKLTCDGSSVTDAEVEQLVSLYGERQVVAMVMLLAYANFQDRLILALRLPPEPDEPLPPLEVRFARLPLGASRTGPARKGPANGRLTPAVRRGSTRMSPAFRTCWPDSASDGVGLPCRPPTPRRRAGDWCAGRTSRNLPMPGRPAPVPSAMRPIKIRFSSKTSSGSSPTTFAVFTEWATPK